MQGKILDYNNELKSGLIRGDDGSKYNFSNNDCKSTNKPLPGKEVDFEVNGDKAIDIYVLTKDTFHDFKDTVTEGVSFTASTVKSNISKLKNILLTFIVMFILFVIAAEVVSAYQQQQREKAERQPDRIKEMQKLQMLIDTQIKNKNH